MTEAQKQKLSAALQKRWRDPKYRRRMMKVQKATGYRTYPLVNAKV